LGYRRVPKIQVKSMNIEHSACERCGARAGLSHPVYNTNTTIEEVVTETKTRWLCQSCAVRNEARNQKNESRKKGFLKSLFTKKAIG